MAAYKCSERQSLKEAAGRWQEILDAEGISEEEAVSDFKRWRSQRKK